jgi:Fe2+ or Zn2+ uptake regulation protein
MKINYQPIVVKKSTQMLEVLEELDFFTEHEIKNKQYVFDYFCDVFTEKFINGEINDNDIIINEYEFHKYLTEIILISTLQSLKENNLVDSIEDGNNEEVFFLTELGKNTVSKIK